VKSGFLIVGVALFALSGSTGLTAFCPRAQKRAPSKYLPRIQDRQHYSDIVCSATVLEAHLMSPAVRLEGEERSQWSAVALVDRVFKGAIDAQVLEFKYYGLASSAGDYFGPPIAEFQSGTRYLLFLKGDARDLEVSTPFYQSEIRVAPQSPIVPDVESNSDLALATELMFAVQSAPTTTGRAATTYFGWSEELIGERSIPLVEPFLSSSNPLIRYQAAWWLSFRKLDGGVINQLENTVQDETAELWARSGARDRLRDINQGKWVP
jgi:hypothetical protein